MGRKLSRLRKQRTRGHVIADLGVHHVEGFILEKGHTAHRLSPDYSYDLVLFTHDRDGYLEPGAVYIQVKASESLHGVESNYVFDIDVRDYHLWIVEEMPVVLILFDATHRCAYWLCVQQYFGENEGRQPRKNARTVRVHVPRSRIVNESAVTIWQHLKSQALLRPRGEQP